MKPQNHSPRLYVREWCDKPTKNLDNVWEQMCAMMHRRRRDGGERVVEVLLFANSHMWHTHIAWVTQKYIDKWITSSWTQSQVCLDINQTRAHELYAIYINSLIKCTIINQFWHS